MSKKIPGKKPHVHLSDLAGISQLAIGATLGITGMAEALHNRIAARTAHGASSDAAGPPDPARDRAAAITKLVYQSVRGVTSLVGSATDLALQRFIPILNEPSSPEREAVLAALNGVLGDHLAETGNPLAIAMRLRRNGQPLTLEREALAAAFSAPAGAASPGPDDGVHGARVGARNGLHNKLLVLVHGLCMNDLQWSAKSGAFEAALARDLGYTVLHLHYNSGLHVSTNGRQFAALLETLFEQWPEELEEFAILAHSMGGLVARSAYHYGMAAGHQWPRRLQKMIFIGTPHHGAPMERAGNLLDACLGANEYSAPFARLGKIRSAGITDMRYGNVLDEDWQGVDRFERLGDRRHPLPLPAGVLSYAIAANIGKKKDGELIGDGMVTVESALGMHPEPAMALAFVPSRQWIGYGMSHWALLSRTAVHQKILRWLGTPSAGAF